MQLRVFCFRTLALSNRIKTSQTWGANTKSEKNNCSLLCDLHDFKKGHHQTSSDGYLSRNKGKQQKNKEFWQQCWLIWGHVQVINDLNYNSILCLIEIIFFRKDILGKKAQTRQWSGLGTTLSDPKPDQERIINSDLQKPCTVLLVLLPGHSVTVFMDRLLALWSPTPNYSMQNPDLLCFSSVSDHIFTVFIRNDVAVSRGETVK